MLPFTAAMTGEICTSTTKKDEPKTTTFTPRRGHLNLSRLKLCTSLYFPDSQRHIKPKNTLNLFVVSFSNISYPPFPLLSQRRDDRIFDGNACGMDTQHGTRHSHLEKNTFNSLQFGCYCSRENTKKGHMWTLFRIWKLLIPDSLLCELISSHRH